MTTKHSIKYIHIYSHELLAYELDKIAEVNGLTLVSCQYIELVYGKYAYLTVWKKEVIDWDDESMRPIAR